MIDEPEQPELTSDNNEPFKFDLRSSASLQPAGTLSPSQVTGHGPNTQTFTYFDFLDPNG